MAASRFHWMPIALAFGVFPLLGNGVAFAQTDQLSNSPGVPAKRPWVVTPRERIVVE